jgi:dUTP pyrophosphatase
MTTTQLSNEHYANLFLTEHTCQNYAVLKLAVSTSHPELAEQYREAVEKHNAQTRDNLYYNSGFDLFLPDDAVFNIPIQTQMLNLEVKGEMIYTRIFVSTDKNNVVGAVSIPSPYYLYPRSSMSKTPLMLANHTGIIDAGYRGKLIVATRWLNSSDLGSASSSSSIYTAEKYTRLFQVCHPSLCPVYVVLVPETELTSTERGEGGFGSTGK